MRAHVEIGESPTLELRQAVLVYAGPRRAFATLHEVAKQDAGAPLLGPAQLLSLGFLRELARALGSEVAPEILPAAVLTRTPEMLVWWTPALRRIMFLGEADAAARKLNGKVFPHPALVFKVRGRELLIRALEKNKRPEATTPLKTAPYWNVAGDGGRVCLGTARAPEDVSVASIIGCDSAHQN